MKDSGVEWIGELPEDWRTIKAKYFYQVISGNGFPEHLQGRTSGELPFYKVSDINESGVWTAGSKNYVSYGEAKKYRWNIIKPESIIMSKIGEALKKNHRKISSTDCLIDNNLQALELKSEQDIYYAYYLWQVIDADWFDNKGTIPSINNFRLLDNKIPTPPLQEQQDLAHYLDQKIAAIDHIIEKTKETIEDYKLYKQSLISEAVTKGLNSEVKLKDSGVEWIGEIPEHWGVIKVKQVATEGDSLFLDGDWIESKDISKEGIRYLTTGNIGPGYYKEQGSGYVSEETFLELNCLEVMPDDLVISRLNEPIGRACLLPNTFSRYVVAVDCVVLRPNKDYDKNFLCYVMNSHGYGAYASLLARGSTMSRISRTQLGGILLPRPPLHEQKEISQFLKGICDPMDKLITQKEQLIEDLEAYKKSLIYEVVTGKREVQ